MRAPAQHREVYRYPAPPCLKVGKGHFDFTTPRPPHAAIFSGWRYRGGSLSRSCSRSSPRLAAVAFSMRRAGARGFVTGVDARGGDTRWVSVPTTKYRGGA
jgi:hypothetical protein